MALRIILPYSILKAFCKIRNIKYTALENGRNGGHYEK